MIKNKKLVILVVTFITFVIIGIVGLTYAFFTASVEGNDEAEATEITTGTLKLRLTDTNVMDMDNAMPGREETKTFTVENIGDTSASYDILLTDVSTSFIGSDLVYTVTSNNDGGSKTETVLPNTDETIIENVVIDAGITQTYTLTITFKETGLDQNQNQGASYTGLIQISPRISSGTVVGYVRDTNGNVMANTLVQMHSEPKETRTNESGYYEFRNVEAGIHTISVLGNSNEVLASKEVTMLVGTETIKQKENIIVIETSPKKYVNLQVAANQGLNINVENAKLMLSETSGDLYVGGSPKSITISGEGYGALSCASSTASATCSITNNILTISPVSTGNGIITVSEDRTNAQVTYTYEVKDTSILLSSSNGILYIDGDDSEITISGTNMGVLYCGTSDNTKATCNISGATLTVTSVGAGNAVITVREGNGNKTNTYSVEVKSTSIELSETSGDINITDTKTITASGLNMGNLTCRSNDETKATCSIENSSIIISPISIGEIIITVTESNGNKTATYNGTITNPLPVKEKIISVETPKSDASIDFTKNSETGGSNGLYYTANATTYGEDGQRIYYYRGDVDNNWVSFGGYYWRIVRTTAEGGVKLVYSGGNPSTGPSSLTTSSTLINNGGYSAFTVAYNSKYYVGYTYNLSSYTGTQTNSSAKTAVDNWYAAGTTTLTDTDKTYLSETAVYCSDRSSERASSGSIYYPAYDRLYTNKRPTFACNKANASRYTKAANSTNGNNGYLTYPIALLSADEIYYAGYIYASSGATTTPYLKDYMATQEWWTMTPGYWNGNMSMVFNVLNGYMFADYVTWNYVNLRPAVSLKSCIIVTGGDGSKETPYTLSNSEC